MVLIGFIRGVMQVDKLDKLRICYTSEDLLDFFSNISMDLLIFIRGCQSAGS